MSKKDYVLIANVVAAIEDYPTRCNIANNFAWRLYKDNPAFKRAVFFKACDIEVA